MRTDMSLYDAMTTYHEPIIRALISCRTNPHVALGCDMPRECGASGCKAPIENMYALCQPCYYYVRPKHRANYWKAYRRRHGHDGFNKLRLATKSVIMSANGNKKSGRNDWRESSEG